MIEYKTEENGSSSSSPNFLNANEQYLLCIANCIATKMDKAREPLTTAIFTKFPEANIYKERLSTSNKGKPGSLIIKGRIAIILGTMYPGSKEYANDNREFRLKWFREGLMALQKLGVVSLAVRENFPEEFGGDWHKYLFHLNEMDKSIKISIYPYVMAIPIFNIVRFRQEDEVPIQHQVSDKNTSNLSGSSGKVATVGTVPWAAISAVSAVTVPSVLGEKKGFGTLPAILTNNSPNPKPNPNSNPNTVLVMKERGFGFGMINIEKFRDPEIDSIPVPKLKLPPIMNRKPILPIKIEAAMSADLEEELEELKELKVKEEEKEEEKEVERKKEVVEEAVKVKKYIANPDWIDLKYFLIHGWDEIVYDPTIKQLLDKVNNFFATKELPKFGDFVPIYPAQNDIFNAFNLCPFSNVRVIILGQDPYINVGEAMGLAFSVAKGVKVPPSLKNIYKELTTDIPGFKEPNHGSLISWAQQGVFLINTALTVREGQSGSHLDAWQPFTDQVISLISQKKENLVFILWGNPAKKKLNVIKNIDKHHIITAAHPSPLSATRGFFGCKCFSQTNNYLAAKGLKEIDWSIPSL
jgi:uracil-DNA glycosylase